MAEPNREANPPQQASSTITFTDDGRLQGHTVVNRVTGTFKTIERTIEFGPLATTHMAGLEPASSHEEAAGGDRRTPPVLDRGLGPRTRRWRRRSPLFRRVTDEFGNTAAVETIEVSGWVSHRQRVALPPGAVVTVRLSDVSRADAPSTVIAKEVIEPEHQVPIPFSLAVAPVSASGQASLRTVGADHSRRSAQVDLRHAHPTVGAPSRRPGTTSSSCLPPDRSRSTGWARGRNAELGASLVGGRSGSPATCDSTGWSGRRSSCGAPRRAVVRWSRSRCLSGPLAMVVLVTDALRHDIAATPARSCEALPRRGMLFCLASTCFRARQIGS